MLEEPETEKFDFSLAYAPWRDPARPDVFFGVAFAPYGLEEMNRDAVCALMAMHSLVEVLPPPSS